MTIQNLGNPNSIGVNEKNITIAAWIDKLTSLENAIFKPEKAYITDLIGLYFTCFSGITDDQIFLNSYRLSTADLIKIQKLLTIVV